MLRSELVNVDIASITSDVGHSLPAHKATFELHISSPVANTDSDSVVLFLPFWGGSASTFDKVVTALHSTRPTTTYISISYPGSGGSPAPPNDDPELHSILPRAEQLLQLLAHEKVLPLVRSKRLVVCAHSMSAKITFFLLSKIINKIGGPEFEIRALLLLGPAPIGPLILPQEARNQQMHAYDNHESAKWVIENVLSAGKLSSDMVDSLAKDCTGMSLGVKGGWLQHGMLVDCTGVVQSISQKWLHLPIRLLVGEVDQVEHVENVMEQTVRPLRQLGFTVQVDIIVGCGHLVPLEAVEDVRSAVSDLTSEQ